MHGEEKGTVPCKHTSCSFSWLLDDETNYLRLKFVLEGVASWLPSPVFQIPKRLSGKRKIIYLVQRRRLFKPRALQQIQERGFLFFFVCCPVFSCAQSDVVIEPGSIRLILSQHPGKYLTCPEAVLAEIEQTFKIASNDFFNQAWIGFNHFLTHDQTIG